VAIAYRAGSLLTTAPAEGAASTTLTWNVPKPTGLADTDIWVVVTGDWQGSGATWTPDASFTAAKAQNDGGFGNCGANVWYKYVASASGQSATYAFTYAPGASNQALFCGGTFALSGGASSTIIDVASGTSNENPNLTISSVAATSTVDGDLCLLVYAEGSGSYSDAAPTWSTPTGYSVIVAGLKSANESVSTHPAVLLGIFSFVQTTHGSVASQASTDSAANTGSWGNVAVLVTFKPASGAAVFTPIQPVYPMLLPL
jgi:hypothetical protein